MAATVLASWRSYSTWFSAPRQPLKQPVNVLKRFSRLRLATRTSPPTFGAVVGRGFTGWKSGTSASPVTPSAP